MNSYMPWSRYMEPPRAKSNSCGLASLRRPEALLLFGGCLMRLCHGTMGQFQFHGGFNRKIKLNGLESLWFFVPSAPDFWRGFPWIPTKIVSVKTKQVIPSDMWDSGGTIGSRNIHAAVDFSGSDLEIIRLGFFWGIVSINQWFLW